MTQNLREIMEQAEGLERERRFAEAADMWSQLERAGEHELAGAGCPTCDTMSTRRAGALFHAGRVDDAIAVLEALRERSAGPELLNLLSRGYLEAGRFTQAQAAAKEALAADPDSILARQLFGRASMGLGEESGPEGGARHWQDAIDQFTDILIMFDPMDEVARTLKLYCVRKRDDVFGDTMKTEFENFTRLLRVGEEKRAFEVLNGLVRVVIEHAIDIQAQRPRQTIQVANNFIAMVERHALQGEIDLTEALRPVFARLHGLAMWAHYLNDEEGEAHVALDRALQAAPDETLPWTSKAELMHVLHRPEEAETAMARAESLVRREHDRFMIGAAYQLMGKYEAAKEWVDKINVEALKDEAYRPDRAASVLMQFKRELEDQIGHMDEFEEEGLETEELVALIKRILSGTAPAHQGPGSPDKAGEP